MTDGTKVNSSRNNYNYKIYLRKCKENCSKTLSSNILEMGLYCLLESFILKESCFLLQDGYYSTIIAIRLTVFFTEGNKIRKCSLHYRTLSQMGPH